MVCSTQKKKSEAEEEKPRERPPLRAYQPDRFSSHVLVILILPHMPEKQRPRPEPNQHSGQPQTKLAGPAPYEPSRVWTRSSCPTKVPRVFVCSPPKLSITAFIPTCPNCPPGVSSTRRTREITWRIGAVVARSAFPFLARPKANCRGNLTLHDFASFILILSIEMHYSASRCNDALAPTYRPSKPLFTIDSMRTVLTF